MTKQLSIVETFIFHRLCLRDNILTITVWICVKFGTLLSNWLKIPFLGFYWYWFNFRDATDKRIGVSVSSGQGVYPVYIRCISDACRNSIGQFVALPLDITHPFYYWTIICLMQFKTILFNVSHNIIISDATIYIISPLRNNGLWIKIHNFKIYTTMVHNICLVMKLIKLYT